MAKKPVLANAAKDAHEDRRRIGPTNEIASSLRETLLTLRPDLRHVTCAVCMALRPCRQALFLQSHAVHLNDSGALYVFLRFSEHSGKPDSSFIKT